MATDPITDVQHITSGAAFDALGLVHRVRVPAGNGPHPTLIMVHGLDGNEDVTWIFGRAAGPEWLILTPRAPLPTEAGYSWYTFAPDSKPHQDSFIAGVAALEKFIDGAIKTYPVDPSRLVLLGFSQGSAMCYAYAMRHRQAVSGVVALSGFIAQLNETSIPPLDGLSILIIHGARDERVPISMARRARERLEQAGAQITYEEADIGHKISAGGLRTLGSWLAARLA